MTQPRVSSSFPFLSFLSPLPSLTCSPLSDQAVAAVLEENTSLITLLLGFNTLGVEGVRSLVSCLKKNMMLKRLGLENAMGVSGSGAAMAVEEELADIIDQRPTLTRVSLYYPDSTAVRHITISNDTGGDEGDNEVREEMGCYVDLPSA